MARVGEPAGEELSTYPVRNVPPEDHRPERDVSRVDALRHRDDVRDDVPVLTRKPAAGSAESRHHLVEDEQDPVPVAHVPNRLEVAVGGRDDSVRSGHGLQEDRCDGLRTFVLEDLLEMRGARADRARIGVPGRTAVRVRIEHADDAGHPRLVRPAARVARQGDSAERRAVVGAIPRDDLVSPRIQARELDRVLVGLGPRVRQERHGEVARRHLGQKASEPRSGLVRHRRPDRAEPVRLLLDRGDDLRVLMSDVDVHELRREVEIALPVVIPEVAPLRPGNRDRVDRVLHRPGVEDELLRVGDDLRAQVRVRFDDGHQTRW